MHDTRAPRATAIYTLPLFYSTYSSVWKTILTAINHSDIASMAKHIFISCHTKTIAPHTWITPALQHRICTRNEKKTCKTIRTFSWRLILNDFSWSGFRCCSHKFIHSIFDQRNSKGTVFASQFWTFVNELKLWGWAIVTRNAYDANQEWWWF